MYRASLFFELLEDVFHYKIETGIYENFGENEQCLWCVCCEKWEKHQRHEVNML